MACYPMMLSKGSARAMCINTIVSLQDRGVLYNVAKRSQKVYQ